jgi:hypothetical protein
MGRPNVQFTLRQMMLSVGALSLLFALHAPFVRDLLRHEALIGNSGIRPAALARENYIFMLSTQPVLIGLSVLDLVLGLECWRRWGKSSSDSRRAAKPTARNTMAALAPAMLYRSWCMTELSQGDWNHSIDTATPGGKVALDRSGVGVCAVSLSIGAAMS